MTAGRNAVELVPVGDGPVCAVLAGVDPGTGQAYALRVLPGAPDVDTRERFAQESRRLATLRGRAAVVVPDGLVQLDDGRWAVRRELCTQSLPELVAFSGPLPTREVVALAVALADALAAVHGVGVVHGSVAPANVLFRPSGDAVLTDAGLALRRAFPARPAANTDGPAADTALPAAATALPAAGTGAPAPETVRDGPPDERSDLYGLGAVLHFAATGRPPPRLVPTSDDRPDETGSTLPPALAGLIADLVAADPRHRPPDASTVVARLRALSGDDARPLSVSLPPGGPFLDFGPAQRRRPRLPWSVLAGIGVVALLAVVLWQRPDRLGDPPAPPPATPPATAGAATPPAGVRVELAEPIDRGNVVDLTWTGDPDLDFAIVVTGEGQPPRTFLAQRGTRYRVRVDPRLSYCFVVQGTDGRNGVVSSVARPIRGASCAG